MTFKIGDKVRFTSKTSKGTSIAPHVYEVEDVLPAIEGVAGLYGSPYVKVKDHHGYFTESAFTTEGDKHE